MPPIFKIRWKLNSQFQYTLAGRSWFNPMVGKYILKTNAMFYKALAHVQYMLKLLHTLLPQQTCAILHIYSLFQSLLWSIQSQMLWIILTQITIIKKFKLTYCQMPNLIARVTRVSGQLFASLRTQNPQLQDY